MFKGVIRPGLLKKKKYPNVPLLRCAQHSRDRQFSDVSGSTTDSSDQDKSDTSGLLEDCLQLFPYFRFFPFPFPFLWVHEVGLQMRSSAGLDAA